MTETSFSKKDEKFMRLALKLAEGSRNLTGWDPAVGCVIVKAGKIISSGFHAEVGSPHAEVWALKKAGPRARGADLYLNLEPCSHWGNNPPCAEAIIKAGVKKVFAAVKDANPLVNGRGFQKLKKSGVVLKIGLLKDEAQKINEQFFKFIKTGRPFVTLKIAESLDGKIATIAGQSQWISGPKSRKFSHYLRSIHSAVLVGTNTVLKDNPSLTVRLEKAKHQPLRVVLDAFGKIPEKARVFDRAAKTLLVVSPRYPRKKLKIVRLKNIEILELPLKNSDFDLKKLLKFLGRKKIAGLLVEGGGETLAQFIEQKLADKIIFFVAPLIIGGRGTVPSIGGEGIKFLKDAAHLKNVSCKKSGQDWVFEGYFS